MRAVLTAFFLIMLCLCVKAQQTYEAATIPKELLAYSSAVVRNFEVITEVKDLDNTIYHVKAAITILNNNADEQSRVIVPYDKSNVIKNIKVVIYDEFGKQITKVSESDFIDQSAVSNSSLYEDSRVKHYLPHIMQYPYTVAYEYEIRSYQSLLFRDWHPNASASTSVENASYTFICKPDFNIKYKEINVPVKVETGANKAGQKTYTWHLQNMKSLRPEPFSPNTDKYLTFVKIAPEKFEYDNLKGSFTNWQEWGKWYYDKLLANRQYLPQETTEHIRSITADITDPKLKAKKIYEYMQGKTHYISVQVGIGGFQPFTAAEVDRLSYSDCKGLVNYTQALLKAVNIDSYYCVVTAGDRKISMIDDFASINQGNHIILCIPFKNDTTWLECTSQTIPFGFLGTFTDDRTVLACTPQGGKLMHTPKYDAATNLQERKASFTITATGELTADMTTAFKGTLYGKRDYLVEASPLERTKYIQSVYNLNNLNVQRVDIKQEKWPQPITTENLKFNIPNYGTDDNGKIRFNLNSIDRAGTAPKDVRNRVNDIYINDGYTHEDEISYTLPAGYRPSRTTLNVSINKPFGKYSATMAMKDGKLVYKRSFEIIDGTYSKDLYPELIDFYDKVDLADRTGILLIKEKLTEYNDTQDDTDDHNGV